MNLFTNLNILKKYSTHINGLLHPKINDSMFYQKVKQYMKVSFENFKFENTSDDANSATEKVSNIFEKMAKKIM